MIGAINKLTHEAITHCSFWRAAEQALKHVFPRGEITLGSYQFVHTWISGSTSPDAFRQCVLGHGGSAG